MTSASRLVAPLLERATSTNIPPAVEGREGGRALVGGRWIVVLSSNDYLGLAGDPDVRRAANDAIDQYGVGTGMNPSIALTPIHAELAGAIASFSGAEAALLFNSCTAANVALLTTLVGAEDWILSDELNHASIVDGCRLSRVSTKVYPHGDVAAVKRLIEEAEGRRCLIMTDGVFSMEGDTAPIPALVAIAEAHGASLAVDDSHAAGVIGPGGRGTAAKHGLRGRVEITTGTFAKAFGAGAGGYVAGPRALIDHLRGRARFYIFTSPMSPASAAAALTAVRIVERRPDIVERLGHNTRRLRDGLRAMGYRLLGGESPITPVLVGEADQARRLSERLLALGVAVPAVAFPIVPDGQARLRAQPSAAHSDDQLQTALDAFEQAGRELAII
jgi:8-amino-7-oxononanoate synthase